MTPYLSTPTAPAPIRSRSCRFSSRCSSRIGAQTEDLDVLAPEPRRKPWAWLLRHMFEIDVSTCVRCGGVTRWLEAATKPDAIARLLAKNGRGPRPPPKPPPKGQLRLAFPLAYPDVSSEDRPPPPAVTARAAVIRRPRVSVSHGPRPASRPGPGPLGSRLWPRKLARQRPRRPGSRSLRATFAVRNPYRARV